MGLLLPLPPRYSPARPHPSLFLQAGVLLPPNLLGTASPVSPVHPVHPLLPAGPDPTGQRRRDHLQHRRNSQDQAVNGSPNHQVCQEIQRLDEPGVSDRPLDAVAPSQPRAILAPVQPHDILT